MRRKTWGFKVEEEVRIGRPGDQVFGCAVEVDILVTAVIVWHWNVASGLGLKMGLAGPDYFGDTD